MTTTESTATARSHTSTSMRRTSWKDFSDHHHYLHSEKHGFSSHNSSSNPFDAAPSKPLAPSTNVPGADIEAQDCPSAKPRFKYKVIACAILLCMILMWMCLVAGILLLADDVVPSAARSYYKMKDMEMNLINTQAAVDMVKSQAGKLYGYMDGYGFMSNFGAMQDSTQTASSM